MSMVTIDQFTDRDLRVLEDLQNSFDGSFKAQMKIRREALSTSDFPIAFQKVTNYIVQQQIAQAEPVWPKVAGRLVVDNLKPQKLFKLGVDQEAGMLNNNAGRRRIPGSLPRVSELTEFPTIAYNASSSEFKTAKNGVRIAFSWEAFKNDDWGQIEGLPKEMAQMATNTNETEVFRLFYGPSGFNSDYFSSANNLSGNAPLGFSSLEAALVQAQAIPTSPSGNPAPLVNPIQKWALIVGTGLSRTAKGLLAATQFKRTATDGTEYIQDNNFGEDVVLVVVPWLPILSPTGSYNNTGWALVPYEGKGAYGDTVANVFLRGYETPELRIKNDQGQALGGGSLSPYDGSFDIDDIQIRLRYFVNGAQLSNFGSVWSKGNNAAGQVNP